MDIASLSAISGIENVSRYAANSMQTERSKNTGSASFESLLNSAMNLVKETEGLHPLTGLAVLPVEDGGLPVRQLL